MKYISILQIVLFLCWNTSLAQTMQFEKYEVEAVNVSMSKVKVMGKVAMKATKDTSIKAFDEPTHIKVKGIDFKDGTIELKVLSRLLPTAPPTARGFIGISFRIDEKDTRFENIYLRPVNARVEDQIRRNHSTQYFSYPDYKFDRLRKEAPEKYESYVDMEMNKWITMRIEVKGTVAKLYIDKNKQPSLIVNDLKLGANVSGTIGFWVETGTEGYFSELKVLKQ